MRATQRDQSVTPNTGLPTFDHPPVVETVLGVQFVPLERFSSLYGGLFWQEVRSDYPAAESKPALEPVVEDFGGKAITMPQVGIQLLTEPDIRYWFIDSSSTQLIQIQRDRFIRNWRKVRTDQLYPHYDTLRPRFEHDWRRFCEFLERQHLGVPDINQCEVTYVNQIPPGAGGWEGFGAAHKVVTVLTPSEARGYLPAPETIHLNHRYLMGQKQGRLHITLQPAIRREDAKEMLQLTLTARGWPASSAPADVLAWFDMGHEWIVKAFADFTTPNMHDAWGRTS